MTGIGMGVDTVKWWGIWITGDVESLFWFGFLLLRGKGLQCCCPYVNVTTVQRSPLIVSCIYPGLTEDGRHTTSTAYNAKYKIQDTGSIFLAGFVISKNRTAREF